MKYRGTVRSFAKKHDLWTRIEKGVTTSLPTCDAVKLLDRLAPIPVRESRATRRLGSYSARGAQPFCIRLQFSQEAHLLPETFLHELAHACHHLTTPVSSTLRLGHGDEWRRWANVFGVSIKSCAKSESLSALYLSRIKIVAVCRRCGATIRRQRRLDRRRTYIHPHCGGEIVPFYD